MNTSMSSEFQFLDPGILTDGDLGLTLAATGYKGPPDDQFPFYRFVMVHTTEGQQMGQITLRIGDAAGVLKFPGHIGFDVDPPYRGNDYAERSTRLLLPFARQHGLKEIWIGCSEDNLASKKICKKLGALLMEIIAVPQGIDLYEQGMRFLCRYCLF